MTGRLHSAWAWWTRDVRHVHGARAIRLVVGLALCFRVVSEWGVAPLVWGPHGLALDHSTAGPNAQALASLFCSDVRVYAALGMVAAGGALMAMNWRPRAGAALAFVPYWLLLNRGHSWGDGGDRLIREMLWMSLLLHSGKGVARRPWVHNAGVVLIVSQAVIIYLTTGLAKAGGRGWIDGTALALAGQDQTIVASWLRDVLERSWISMPATLGVLMLELWFPIAIISNIRRPFLFAVMGMHLMTMVGMHLVTFGGVMIGLNLMVMNDSELTETWDTVRGALERGLLLLRRPQPESTADAAVIDRVGGRAWAARRIGE